MNTLSNRFYVDKFDQSTFIVIDSFLNLEFCSCTSNPDEAYAMSAEMRAKFIADSLNISWRNDRKLIFSEM